MSHPMWVCGLKLSVKGAQLMSKLVAPYVGVWIETRRLTNSRSGIRVAPYVGVWIETNAIRVTIQAGDGRTLCGCVD